MAFCAHAEPRRILSTNLCADLLLLHHIKNKNLSPNRIIALSPFYDSFNQHSNNTLNDYFLNKIPTHSGNLEEILYLQPDLILSGEFDSILKKENLKKKGFQVETLLLPQNLEELKQLEEQFLNILHLPLSNFSAPTKPFFSNPPKALLVGPNFIAAGKSTFESALMEHAGFQNAADFSGFQAISLEKMLFNPPDFLFYTSPTQSPSLSTQIPLKNISVTPLNDWRLQCAGPWSWEVVEFFKKIKP